MSIRDDINFHTFLHLVRVNKKISLERLGYGLYSKSMMLYIENGERLPDYRMRNRLIGRMGISSDRYEDYIQFDEYDNWLLTQKIITSVENNDVSTAEKELNHLIASSDESRKVERQFILDMQARVLVLKGENVKEAQDKYIEAIEISVPGFSFDNIQRFLLSPDEYYLIIKWLILNNCCIDTYREVEIQKRSYESVITSIKNSVLTNEGKAKVFPMAVYGYSKMILDQEITDKSILGKLLDLISEAIEELRTIQCAYYLQELLEIRREFVVYFEEENRYDEADCWLGAIKDIRDLFGIPSDIENSGYIYNDSEVFCISEVIKSRRKMYNLTVGELSKDLCSEKTIRRIEGRKARPQQFYVERLFEKLGVGREFKRSEIVSYDAEVLEKFYIYKQTRNDNDLEKAAQLQQYLISNLDHRCINNRQILARMINMLKLSKGVIGNAQYCLNLEKTLEMTIPDSATISGKAYLTATELVLIYHLFLRSDKEEYRKVLMEKCYSYKAEGIRNHIRIYELIMGMLAIKAGNKGDHAEAGAISKEIIIADMKNYRLHSVHRNVFNITWNKAKIANDIFSDSVKTSLTICKNLSDYCRDNKTKQFYEERIKLFDERIDWTE